MSQNDLDKIQALIDLITELRQSQPGCAWTKQQTVQSLARYTLEEAYELIDACEQGDMDALRAELGDVLYHVLFYTQIAREQNWFNLADVAQVMLDKHHARRPKPDKIALTAEEVDAQWEASKQAQRVAQNPNSLLDDIIQALPALTRALKLQQRAAQVGFDWNDIKKVFAKLDEEVQELKNAPASTMQIEEEVGDILFTVVNLARHLNIDPETALRKTNQKFIRRFQYIEQQAKMQQRLLTDMSLEEMDVFWNEAKTKV